MRVPLSVPVPFNPYQSQQNQPQTGQTPQPLPPTPSFGSHLHLPPGISPPPPLLPNGSPVSSTVLQYSPSFSSFNGGGGGGGSGRGSISSSSVPPPPPLLYTHTPPSPMHTFLPSPTHISGPFPNSSPSHGGNGSFSLVPAAPGSAFSHSPSPTFQPMQSPGGGGGGGHGIPPPPVLPRTHAPQMAVLTQMQSLHLDGSTRDYPLPSPHSASRTPLFNPSPAPAQHKQVSPQLPSFDLSVVAAHQASMEAEAAHQQHQLPAAAAAAHDGHTLDEEEEQQREFDQQEDGVEYEGQEYADGDQIGDGEDAREAEEEEGAAEAAADSEEEEEEEEAAVQFDPSDLLGRLVSIQRIRADDTSFWSRCMEGMEWAFQWDSSSGSAGTAPEVQRLVHQYCKSFVATAARSRNLHALLLVICRHLENYSQGMHMLSAAGGAASPHGRSGGGGGVAGDAGVAAAGLGSMAALSKDHVWVTQLLFFLRIFMQYLLTNLPYEETLRFFSHLAVPDAASKPATPKAPSSTVAGARGLGGPYSGGVLGQEQWSSTLTVPGQLRDSRSPSPPSPGGGNGGRGHTPLRHHTINLNPSSRRGSLNPQSDILTRFVCAIANTLEVLADTPLNQSVANAKPPKGSGGGSSAKAASLKAPLSSPTSAAAAAAAASAAAAGSSPTSSSSGKGSQPLSDLHLELLNTLFVLLSTQMYLPLSTAHEQLFLDRLLYCARPPLLNSMQGFVTALVAAFTEILPADDASTALQRARASTNGSGSGGTGGGPVGGAAAAGAAGAPAAAGQGFFSKLTSKLTNLLYMPVRAVRSLFAAAPNHPLVERSTLLLELLVYQSSENEFRTAIRALRDADPPCLATEGSAAAAAAGNGSAASQQQHPAATVVVEEDLSLLSPLERLEAGAVSFSRLYYALCATLLSEHTNLFLYTLIHENRAFRQHVLAAHAHDLDALIMPQLEILYREVDISKHHVYMVINIWILLTQHQGFDHAVRAIRVREVPFFKECPLRDLTLSQVMQIVLLRTLQLNLRTKLKEPHIFNNVAAAFCNLTITALIGPPLSGPTPATSPAGSAATTPAATPGSSGSSAGGASVLSLPLALHPQVSFRLVRVLCILSRKFVVLQVRHEAQVLEHNARVEQLAAEGRDELTDDEEREEAALEEVAEELGTCMEFIQLLLEVVNHAIVHALPPPNPLAPPDAARRAAQSLVAAGEYKSSLASNPALLYNLVHSKEYFLQLLPYAHLFEAGLIANIANTVAFYEVAPGVEVPSGTVARAAAAGGGAANHASKQSEREVERCVAALSKAISHTPMSSAPHSPSPRSGAGAGAALPPGSCPQFEASALIERGPFTYHEQENSQDFFVPYIYQLAQTMRVLPRMYASDGPSPVQAALAAASGAMGDVDADAEFIRELEAEEEEEILAADGLGLGHRDPQHSLYGDEDEEEDPIAAAAAAEAAAQLEDHSKLRIAIK